MGLLDVHLHEEPAITAIRKTAIRTTLTASCCAAALLGTVTACGTVENITAGKKVERAVDKLAEQRSLSFELSLDADPDVLDELMADSAGDTPPGEGPPPGFADFLSDARISVSVQSKKPLSASSEKDIVGTSMSIAGADGELVEYRLVGDTAYFRADTAAVGKAMGFPMPTADQLPKEAAPLKAALEGKWVKIDQAALEEAQKDAGEPEAKPSLDAKTERKLTRALKSVIAREVTFKDKGSKDGVDHVTAKANARDLLTGIFDKLGPLTDELPPGAELPTAKDFKDVPDKKIAIDFAVKNDALDAITFDLAQLAGKSDGLKKGTKLPLSVKFGEGKKVTAPAGATELDLGLLMGMSPLGYSALEG
ncbi:hypothetical protein [Streptomyces sp. NBC_01304]|uniref:hypothetical protein n=1 Tax=Streptomyces sp. NBC_01304 TaxID=2903818 RepID=UPI002E1301FD|nr:hypothetical protein OG430_21170 [Streptomyces sp. NBC_01304]